MNKTIKINCDRKYINIVLHKMLEYIEKGDGVKFNSNMYNHHEVFLELNTSVNLRCDAYETKTMIVIYAGTDD